MTSQQSQVCLRNPPARKILLCVTGLSPQIVTETLYALAVARPEPWVPTEIRILTTKRGAENVRLMLLSDQPGWFHRLCKDWKLPSIAFDTSHIQIIQSTSGTSLDDILDDDDNQCAADCIADCVRRLTCEAGTEIHASIAGGRKTMGFFLGYAMSLWGRPQDRLSHVLVSSPYESRAEFFYPTPGPHVIAAKDCGQDSIDAANARVWLGDIPFVRLRDLLPKPMLVGKSKFADAVAAANTALDQVSLEIGREHSTIYLNNKPLRLKPMQFALLTILAWRKKNGLSPLLAPNKEVNDEAWKNNALNDLCLALGEMNIPDSIYRRLSDSDPIGDTFNEQLSKFKKALRDSGILPLKELVIHSEDLIRGRQRSYELALDADQIQFLNLAQDGKLAKTSSVPRPL